MDNWLSLYAQELSNLTPETLPRLGKRLAETVEFRDPFNHTYSRDEFMLILEDMYQKLEQVTFDVHEEILQGHQGVLYWTFSAYSQLTGEIKFEGNTRVMVDGTGKILLHHDYWDASELMQKIPLIGAVIKKLRRKMSHNG